MESDPDSSDDEHQQHHHEPQPILHTPTQVTTEVSRIFQQNIKEEKNQMTVLQIRRTVREKIFPFMKFTNEYVLRQMKLRESDNMVHLLLQDLNRLDDNDISRAKFWLSYKNEVRTVITTRKTEVTNQMKSTVVNCKYIRDKYIDIHMILTHSNCFHSVKTGEYHRIASNRISKSIIEYQN